jgi:aminoglycoside phosphotransferase (APT) family kinase protein
MGLQGRASVANHFEGYLAEPGNSPYQPVLRHGDFGPTNILFDSVSRTISGIVDFVSAGVGDPALDLAGVASDLIPPRYGSGEPCGPPAASRCSAALRAPFRGDPPHEGRFAQHRRSTTK